MCEMTRQTRGESAHLEHVGARGLGPEPRDERAAKLRPCGGGVGGGRGVALTSCTNGVVSVPQSEKRVAHRFGRHLAAEVLGKGALDGHGPRGALIRAVDGVVGAKEIGGVATLTLEHQRVAEAIEQVGERMRQRSAVGSIVLGRLC